MKPGTKEATLDQILEEVVKASKGIDDVKEAQEAQAKTIQEHGASIDEINKYLKELEEKEQLREERERTDESKTMVRKSGVVFNPSDKTVSLPGLELEKDKFSFTRATNGIVTGDWGYGFEKAVFDETRNRRKDLSASDDALGGFLVPVQVLDDFIELLRANTVVREAGATVLNNLMGSPVELPKQTGGATAFWVSENGAITSSDIALGQVKLEPRSLGALVKLSNRVLRLSSPGIEGIVRDDLARVMALALDLAALRGTGSSGQPLGIANTSNINEIEIAADGGDFTFFHADRMRQALAEDNAERGRLAFISHPSVWGKMRRERIAQFSGQTEGQYVILPLSDDNMRAQLGFPFFQTTQIPTNLTKATGTNLSEVYFGNWQELLVGMWTNMEFLASNVAGDATGGAFAQNQTWLRVIMEVDTAVRHPESFCLINDAATV